MKSCIFILVIIGAIIYAFIFLDEAARDGGVIGVLAGLVALFLVGMGYYSLFSNDRVNRDDK